MKKVIPVFMLISIFVCSFAVVNAEVIEYVQDFESVPIGDVPPEFVRVFTMGNSATGRVVDSGPVNKVYEHICISGDGTPAGVADLVQVTLSDPVFYIWMQVSPDFNPTAYEGSINILFSSGDGHALSVVFLGSDGMMYVSVGDAGDYVPVLPFTPANIYELLIEVDLTTHTYSVFIDDAAVAGAQDIGMEITSSTDTFLAFITNANAGGNGVRMLVDNIRIVSEGDPPTPINPQTGDSSFDIMPLIIALLLFAGGIIFKRFVYSG